MGTFPAFLPRRSWRYALFLLLCLSALPLGLVLPWPAAIMAGFDGAALLFLLTLVPLFRHDPARMRVHARRNDANRRVMLLLTGAVTLVILVAVATELHERQAPTVASMVLILATLALAWVFSNSVYALHYAFLYYSADGAGADRKGLEFPGGSAPDYRDFAYFSFTLGMTFQTSDVVIASSAMRSVALVQGVAAFVFNLGVLAFTINVLGG